jgi:endonuclease/exonuclease/phosphatase (EEP) superfamily protein YafD
MPIIRHAFRGLALIISGLLVAWLPLRQTRAAGWWVFQLADILEPWLFVPVPIMLLAAGLARDVTISIVIGGPAISFLVRYGARFWPHRVRRADSTIRVMTTNVRSDNRDIRALAIVLEREQPDIVALQELSGPLASSIGTTLRKRYPHQVLVPQAPPRTDKGMGILSRYPIACSTAPRMGEAECACQLMTIDVFGGSIQVVNVHPVPPEIRVWRLGRLRLPRELKTANQSATQRALTARLGSVGPPRLVVGDFNMSEQQPFYAVLREHFTDSYRQVGWGLGHTFPDGPFPEFPVVRLDYIFHDEHWRASRAWTGALQGSDHRYVVADLSLRG